MKNVHQSLSPRNGDTLVVGIVARISGCQNQKELSLEDQVDHAKDEVRALYDGTVKYHIIATKGKGERLDREELQELEVLLRSSTLDLLIAEDLGRIVRGAEAVWLLGVAVDHGTRVLSPNDFVDTAETTWEEDAMSACRDHLSHNAHTSKRLKHKLMNRFIKFGGATARPIYGYKVPEGAKFYGDWQKDPSAIPIIQEGARRLLEGLNCSAVADWFNVQGVSVGDYCRRKTWTGAMVRRFYSNPLLKGKPGRGYKHTIKHHETGRRIAVKSPTGPVLRDHPELAHLLEVEFDLLNARLKEKNAPYRRKTVGGQDPLYRMPRKRTRFPGQHALCWYCGRQYVWGGNGITSNLMCSGAREWKCWNSLGFNGALASQRLVEVVTAELHRVEGVAHQFAALVDQAYRDGSDNLSGRWAVLRVAEATLAKEKENLQAAVADWGPTPMLREKLDQLEALEKELKGERWQLENLAGLPVHLPRSAADLRGHLEQEFQVLSGESPEFGDVLRLLVPQFYVYLVRLCDGGHLLPRAKVTLNLAGSFPDSKRFPQLGELLTRGVTIDLFEAPPQREAIRLSAVALQTLGLTQREICQRLPGRPTQPAVAKVLALHERIVSLGLESPYLLVQEPPADFTKLRRHKNAKYRFEPLEGYERQTI